MKQSDPAPQTSNRPSTQSWLRKSWLRTSLSYALMTAASAGTVLLVTEHRTSNYTAANYPYETLQYSGATPAFAPGTERVNASVATEEPLLLAQATGTERLVGGANFIASAAERVGPAVVRINSARTVVSRGGRPSLFNDPFFPRFVW